jgi:polyhydroxyalkanoate synthesis regulator phasin
MTKQYQTPEGAVGEVTAKPVPVKTERVSDQKIMKMANDLADLQQELVRTRSDIAKLKNRISDLERNISPRG